LARPNAPYGAGRLLRFVGYPLRGTLDASDRFAVILLGKEEVGQQEAKRTRLEARRC
jgi:hypothetical protein